MTLDQGFALALQALRSGQPDVALQLSDALLQARPKDPVLHYLKANAHADLGQVRKGRKAAARSYRLAEKSEDKFQAAQLASRMALGARQYTLSQVWLRRTAIHAPDDESERLIARDYRVLRQLNPWAFRLRGELSPSDNVNGGADTSLQIIDGVPVVGQLSGGAQALSGLIASVDLAVSYRLRQTQDSRTTLGSRFYVQRVKLSSSSEDKAPDFDESELDSTFAEFSFRHLFAVGKPERGGSASVGVAAGSSYWGGERAYNFARISGDRTWRLNNGAKLRFGGLGETRFAERFGTNDANILGLGGYLTKPLQNGDTLSLDMAFRDTKARWDNGTFYSASIRVAYGFGKPVGPVLIDTGLVLGYSHYPRFLSAGFIEVPGGRTDKSIYGDVSFFFHRYDYAGFAPVLRLRTGKRSSNDSRYDISETSLSLGIESTF
ncbi:hypothetical protein [Ruegeria hyattellae]|uniref:hypothetical protein n=1 Tax=Ruegeria hyattellae TaxID=3233337 RepID=UPI00355BAFDD